jgi:hypothetical protein
MADLVMLDADLEVVQLPAAVFGDAGQLNSGGVGAARPVGGLGVYGHGS